MIIPITDDYRITSDERQYVVERCHIAAPGAKQPGIKTWRPVPYHLTLEQAGDSVTQRLCREIDAEGYSAVMLEIQRLHDTVREALTL